MCQRRFCFGVAASALGATLFVGCAGTSTSGPPASTDVLSVEDFLVANVGVVQHREITPDLGVLEPIDPVSPPTIEGDNPPQTPDENTNNSDDVPTWTRPAQLSAGDVVVIDSLVGQINGRPVYANAFFAPIDAHLRVRKEQLTNSQFEDFLELAIEAHLNEILQSELFIAEALSQLTTEQQQGLLAFLTQQREYIVSTTGGGSIAIANKRLRDEGYGDVDTRVKEKRDEALIQMLLQQEVRPRVIISWRDLEKGYQRFYDQFNKLGSIHISQVYLTQGEQDDEIEQVNRRLAEGADFREVAREVGMRETVVDKVYPLTIEEDGGRTIEGPKPLYLEKLQGLEEGDTTPSFEQVVSSGDTWTVWLHVVKVEPAMSKTIYDPDVQLALKNVLFQERFLIEQQRYFMELLDEGIMSDLDSLKAELLDIARDRF